MRSLAQLAVAQALLDAQRARAVQHTGQVLSGDASGGFSVNLSGVTSPATLDQAVQAYGDAQAATGDQQQRLQIAEQASVGIVTAIPAVGLVAGPVLEYVFQKVGPAHGGTGLCGDGQPHPEAFGTWESNIGAYDATKGGPLTSAITGTRVFGPASDFETMAYAALRKDYDAGLNCTYSGGPPKPLGTMFLALLKSYNKVHADRAPVTHVRRWTTGPPGTFGGKPTGTLSLEPWANDPITYALGAEIGGQVTGQPIGNTMDPKAGLVLGRVISVSFTANTGPARGSTSTNIPKGASLIPPSYKPPPPPAHKIVLMPLRMGSVAVPKHQPVTVAVPGSAPVVVAPPAPPKPSLVGLSSLVVVSAALAVGFPWVALGSLGIGALVGAYEAWKG